MKNRRQEAICNLIRTKCIDTQAALARLLKEQGFDAAQTTVSRDIKELKLVKVPSGDGGYKYTLPENAAVNMGAYTEIFAKNIKKAVCSECMLVLHTLPATATLVAQSIDAMGDRRILGTVSGYDTVFAAMDCAEHAEELCDEMRKYIKL